ncbi:MAG TPA: hypothetical protein VGI43_04275 [Mucilaginibacter sp.]|jgi:hypothetical protein
MKKLFFAFLAICVFATCKGRTDSSTNKPTGDSSIRTQKLIKKFTPIIQGDWINKYYAEKLIQSKSPLAALNFRDVVSIEINTDSIKGDSLVCLGGDAHDSGYSTLKFVAGKKPSTIKFNGQDLSYSVEKGDTTIRLAYYDGEKKQFLFHTYIRAFKRLRGNLGDALEEYIDKMLVAGNYNLIDSTKSSITVHFDEKGQVKGFLDFDKYFVNYDLNSDVNDNLDAMYFKGPNHEQLNFTFKISADTLKLYDTNENVDSTELLVGKLKYKLVRQR